MTDYHWRDRAAFGWTERFPGNVIGGGEWGSQVLQPGQWTPPHLPPVTLAHPPRPTLFVSHRSIDVTQAERVAYLANRAGFDYWLDVFDPSLQALQSAIAAGALTAQQAAAAVALVVEMALLNCTHLLAVITRNTRGSWWVPYEFGRAQDATLHWPAASWTAKSVTSASIGEFLLLRQRHQSDRAVERWLNGEMTKWVAKHGQPSPPNPWSRPIPPVLK